MYKKCLKIKQAKCEDDSTGIFRLDISTAGKDSVAECKHGG